MVRITVLLALLLTSLQGLAEAVAKLDRTTISDNETVTLTITVDETSLFSSPDIAALEKNFTVLNQQKSSRSQWINGRSSASTEWHFVLAPKRTGVITIPAIEVAGFTTDPQILTVKETRNTAGTSHDPIFIEVSTDADSVYVQEQLLLTLKINRAIQVSNLQLSPLAIDNARVEEVSNTRYERRINNKAYITHEVAYAIFPQQSGTLTIPPIEVTASVPRTEMEAMMRQGQSQRFRSDTIDITVKPAEQAGANWLVADRLTLHESWSADPQSVKVGQSITRTITTTAEGLMAEQLPDIALQEPDGARLYPEKPVFENDTDNNGVTGKRTDRITLIATRPGQIRLPAISINWWNRNSGRMETATLAAITLNVSGEALAPVPVTVTDNKASDKAEAQTDKAVPEKEKATTSTGVGNNAQVWQLATAVLGLLSLTLAVCLWFSRRQTVATSSAPAATEHSQQNWRQLKSACHKGRPALIRQALLVLFRQLYPEKPVHALADINRLLPDDDISLWLQRLDAALYLGEHQAFDWDDFYRLLEKRLQRPSREHPAGLYPTR